MILRGRMMVRAKRFLFQVFNYSLFMAVVWYFSFSPPYHRLDDHEAVITVAVSHAGKRIHECTKRTQEELLKLPPNMRKLNDCPRGRSPVTVELLLDSKPVLKEIADAPGFYNDQGIDIFESVKIPSGRHTLELKMNDDIHIKGSTHQFSKNITLTPAQHLVVLFNATDETFKTK